ncbi:MAG: hypothetical protein K0S14_1230 [Thermomicrobiales bacterium]|jgi:hypothetical protein|nr:hypothetical protein [Thermomicrobiales bacterium]MCD6058669.1 hypothetical protein [Thermomicrobiales bacterium]MDF2759635.1 hypothetical protein [Thermomicrobiales bacterium]MDF3015207.1 hypothetical protein [Thermomicrobiales bacterium]
MDDAKVDRLARAIAKPLNRRLTVALLCGVTGIFGQQIARGFQLGPATCGEQGAVCTLVAGCCDGLTCVTSAINTSYGICVPGEGGMVSTGTTLISPFSETAVEEISALIETSPTIPATDPQAEREARAGEIRARRESRRTERKTRLDTRGATVEDRKDEKPNREPEEDDTEESTRGLQLQLKLSFAEVDGDSTVDDDPLVPIEVVRVTNRDDVKVVLTSIETIMGAPSKADLTTSQFTLGPKESYSFVSGLPTEDAANAATDRYQWLDKVACNGTIQGQGYRVNAAFSRGKENHEFVVFCDGPHMTGATKTAATPPRKRKKNDEQKHKRNSQHKIKKKR